MNRVWQAADVCQDLDPRAERLSVFIPVVSPADTFTTRFEAVNGHASRKEPSNHLSTSQGSKTVVYSAADDNSGTHSGWWACPRTICTLFSRLRVRVWGRSGWPHLRVSRTALVKASKLPTTSYPVRTSFFECCLTRVPIHLVGDIMAFERRSFRYCYLKLFTR